MNSLNLFKLSSSNNFINLLKYSNIIGIRGYSSHYNKRNSFTHQKDIKASKKRELKKEAVQRGEDPPIITHTKQNHEHTQPLNHKEKVELKKKVKKKLKSEIKAENEERLKHIKFAEDLQQDQITQEQMERLKQFNIDDLESDVTTSLSSGNTSQQKVYYSEYDDQEALEEEEDINFVNDDDIEASGFKDLPGIDLSKIQNAKIIQVDDEFLSTLPVGEDGEPILPEFISLKDAKKKFGFNKKDLHAIEESYKQTNKKTAVAEQDIDDEQEIKEIQKLQDKLNKRREKLIAKQEKKKSTTSKSNDDAIEGEIVKQEEEKPVKRTRKSKKLVNQEIIKEEESRNVKTEEQLLIEKIQKEHLDRISKGKKKMDLSPVTIDQVMEVLAESKLDDFVVLDVSKKCTWADYLVLASSDSIRLLATAEEDLIKSFKHRFENLSSNPKNTDVWKVVDLKSVVIHLLETPLREHYDLETLWATRRGANSTELSWDDECTSKLGEDEED